VQPKITLFEHVGLGLIIEYPSGVAYSNQTGGTSCLAPSLEGVFVPLRNDCVLPSHELLSPEHALVSYFDGPKWRGTGATQGIDCDDADFIERLLSEHRLSHCINVDRTRLCDSHEAWIHITVSTEEASVAPVFSGFGPYPRHGVLTWTNTD
jgi:hypothetical protein